MCGKKESGLRQTRCFLSLLPVLESDFRLKSPDPGCGRGRHPIHLAKEGLDGTAIDSSRRAVEHGKRKFVERDLPSKVYSGSFLNLPFQNCPVDVEVAWDALYQGTRKGVEVSVSAICRTMRK